VQLRERLDGTMDIADAARKEGDSVIRIPRSRDRISNAEARRGRRAAGLPQGILDGRYDLPHLSC
jgi:hypothetical protein